MSVGYNKINHVRMENMNTTLSVIINIIIMIGIIYGLYIMQKKHVSFTKRVLLALVVGIVYGAILQMIYGAASPEVIVSNSWFSVIGTGYVRLLRMIVIPLIFVSITSAIVNQKLKILVRLQLR